MKEDGWAPGPDGRVIVVVVNKKLVVSEIGLESNLRLCGVIVEDVTRVIGYKTRAVRGITG